MSKDYWQKQITVNSQAEEFVKKVKSTVIESNYQPDEVNNLFKNYIVF